MKAEGHIAMAAKGKYSDDCLKVLSLLKISRNVLISGPPGTGKSRLLGEIADAFLKFLVAPKPAPTPVHIPGAKVSIPAKPPAIPDPILQSLFPCPGRADRRVFRTAFHQNSKYRDFVTGLVPNLSTGGTGVHFKVSEGILYRASEHAKNPDGAALLIIDEINRGPAVQVFGGSIVAIETDKRLAPDGSKRTETQFFEVTAPDGTMVEYALPHYLYILAAMNQADVSVEPLDVAFLRRWAPYDLEPDGAILREYFGLDPTAPTSLPHSPSNVEEIFEAAIAAWEAINQQIRLGRGAEFQVGHGILMDGLGGPAKNIDEALASMACVWQGIRAHVNEVFFGDTRGIAAALNIGTGGGSHLYTLKEELFADEPRLELDGPRTVKPDQIYALLLAVGRRKATP